MTWATVLTVSVASIAIAMFALVAWIKDKFEEERNR